MGSSGQLQSEFMVEMECVDCGLVAEVDVFFDPEEVERYLFVCPDGHENRPELDPYEREW